MTTIVPHMREARRLLGNVWAGNSKGPALAAVAWLYGDEGAEPLLTFASRMETASEDLKPLVRDIFQLQCEIAARKAGWCPELEPQPNY